MGGENGSYYRYSAFFGSYPIICISSYNRKNRYKNALTFLCWLIISFIYTISFGLYLAGMTEPKNVRIVSFALKICFYTLIPVMAMISIYFYRCFFRSKGGEKSSSPHSVLDKTAR